MFYPPNHPSSKSNSADSYSSQTTRHPYLVVVIIVNLHLIAVPVELWDGSATDNAVEAHRVALPHLKVSWNLLELRLGVGLKDATLLFRAALSLHRVPGEDHSQVDTQIAQTFDITPKCL